MKTLYPDQLLSKREIYHNWNNGITRQVLGAPTGSGKTVVALSIIEDAISKGKKPLFIVDRITLAHQTTREFSSAGLNVTMYQGENTTVAWNEQVIVGSVHTLKNMRIPDCDLIIIDECHINHKHYKDILDTYNNVKTLGMSATPESPWLAKYFETIVKAPSMGELINIGRLVPFRVFNIDPPDYIGKVKKVAGEWHQAQLSDVYGDLQHVGKVVENWIENGEGRKTIAFTVTINEAKIMADNFIANGVNARHMDCYMKDEEVKDIFDSYHNGQTDVIVSVGKLTTGFDSPMTSCIIDDAPTMSIKRHIQKYGRGPRVYPGKKDVLIFDHTFNTIILCHPAQYEIPDLLGDEEKEKKVYPKTYKCKAVTWKDDKKSKCGYISEIKFTVCPQCGKEKVIASDDYRKEIGYERVEAKLTEIDPKKKANKNYTNEEKREFYSGLKGYAKKKLYNSGWASHKYKEKFGVWPNAYKDAKPKEPNEEVTRYIRYLNIRMAFKNKKTQNVASV